MISINKDLNDLTFISTIEHHTLPFYGTQYHPEKNNFEWAIRLHGIPHTSNAIRVSHYFSDFFVNEGEFTTSSLIKLIISIDFSVCF